MKLNNSDFPFLKRGIVYLDNAATSQKPQQVIDAISDFYANHNANVHRGIHTLSEEASNMYEAARKSVAKFINARVPEEIIFTKNTTEGLNLVAQAWAMNNLREGDEIVVGVSEHHSNLLPWRDVVKRTGAVIVDEISPKTKLVALSHASNVLGEVFPVKELTKKAKAVGAVVIVDGAQAVPHMKVDVQSLGVDFYAFSGHKMLGPTGIGVLYGKKELLSSMPAYQTGGGMVTMELPDKFEAGTPNIAGAIGLAEAIKYLENIGLDEISKHESELSKYLIPKLSEFAGLKILGPKDNRVGLVAFTIDGLHAHDVAAVLNNENIAVRSGQHCTQPLHDSLGIAASVRASWYIYNTKEDMDTLVEGLRKVYKILK